MKTIENIRHDAQSLHKDSDILEVRDVLIATLEAMEIMDIKDDSTEISRMDDRIKNNMSDISAVNNRVDKLSNRIDSLEEDDRDSVINALEDD